jgi:hypothetical protein
MELRDRETYDTVVNPYDPRVMWVYEGTRSKGAFLGLAKRDLRACRADAEATQRKWGRVETRTADLLADSRRRNTHRTQDAMDRKQHNAGVISAARQGLIDTTRRATDALDASLPDFPLTNNTNETDTTEDTRHDDHDTARTLHYTDY